MQNIKRIYNIHYKLNAEYCTIEILDRELGASKIIIARVTNREYEIMKVYAGRLKFFCLYLHMGLFFVCFIDGTDGRQLFRIERVLL